MALESKTCVVVVVDSIGDFTKTIHQTNITLEQLSQEMINSHALEIKALERDLYEYCDADYQHEDFGTDFKQNTNIETRTSLVLVKHENPNCPIRGTPC